MTDASKVLVAISKCDDPDRLRTFIKNAQNKNENGIADAAFRRLISLVPSEEFGTVEHDFWQTVNAFEYALSEERGKTTRLARTRQKVGRVGVIETLSDCFKSPKFNKNFESYSAPFSTFCLKPFGNSCKNAKQNEPTCIGSL